MCVFGKILVKKRWPDLQRSLRPFTLRPLGTEQNKKNIRKNTEQKQINSAGGCCDTVGWEQTMSKMSVYD